METTSFLRYSVRSLSKRICVGVLLVGMMTLFPGLALGQKRQLQTELESIERTRGLSITNQQGQQVACYKESHALVIGVSNYTNGWPRLPGVQRDVQAVKAILEEHGFNVIVHIDLDKDGIEQAFDEFINVYGQEPENRLVVYFAGHGHTDTLAYGGEMGYIVPADAPLPQDNKSGFFAKAMDMQMIEVYARRIQAKHALFVFDSCFSGSIFAIARAAPEHITHKTANPVRQFITSGSANEQVPDESVFRQQFVAALQGAGDRDDDGYVTGAELGIFLEDMVMNYTKNVQHPQYGKIRDQFLDKGDFVFKLPETSTPTSLRPPTITPLFDDDLKLQMEWHVYLTSMEDAFATAQQYEQLDFPADAKKAAWEQFLAMFSADNPYSTRDEELRLAAQERIRFWQEHLLPTPVLTVTPKPPTSMPEQVLRIDSVVIEDAAGKVIQPEDGIYTLKVEKPVTLTVNVTNSQQHPLKWIWKAGHGKLSSTNAQTTAQYTAEKKGSDYVLIRIEDEQTGKTVQKSINLSIVQ